MMNLKLNRERDSGVKGDGGDGIWVILTSWIFDYDSIDDASRWACSCANKSWAKWKPLLVFG